MTIRIPLPPLRSADFASAFPNSRKVYVGNVPMAAFEGPTPEILKRLGLSG